MHLTRNKQQQSVMARIMRDGKMHQKSFSRKQFKTWENAEKAARKWINEKIKELGPSQANAPGRMTRRNKSGVVGVCRLTKSVSKNGKTYRYPQWYAKWPGCPLKGGIRFTVTRDCTEEEAFALAVLAREMESVDRDEIQKKLNRIRGRKSHLEIIEKFKTVSTAKKRSSRKKKTAKKKTATAAKAQPSASRRSTSSTRKKTVRKTSGKKKSPGWKR